MLVPLILVNIYKGYKNALNSTGLTREVGVLF